MEEKKPNPILFLILLTILIWGVYELFKSEHYILAIIFFFIVGGIISITTTSNKSSTLSPSLASSYKGIKIMCTNCKDEYPFEIFKTKSDLPIYDFGITRVRDSDGLDIYGLICFNCNRITEWAVDHINESKNAIHGIEYFSNYALTSDLKSHELKTKITATAILLGHKNVEEKMKKLL
jgi:hypothetical protein